jgi:hypothetical protein
MTRFNRIALALPCVALALAGCAGPVRPEISLNPAATIVDVGSTTTFTAVFSPRRPQGSSLTWEVIPATGGTISSKDAYTAPETPGHYTVVAIWTSAYAEVGSVKASASVEVLPVPQADAVTNPDMAQASAIAQRNGGIQNGVVIGQPFPSVISADPNGNIKTGSGFTPPITCTDCSVVF